MVAVGDPVATGIVASLGRPGGNITGLTSISEDLEGKRLELLREVLPTISRVTVLWNPDNRTLVAELREIRAAAQVLRMTVQALEVRTPGDLEETYKDYQGTAGSAPGDGGSFFLAQSSAPHGLCYQTAPARGICAPRIGRGRRVDVLWAELPGHAQTSGLLRGQNPETCEAHRPACGAADEV